MVPLYQPPTPEKNGWDRRVQVQDFEVEEKFAEQQPEKCPAAYRGTSLIGKNPLP